MLLFFHTYILNFDISCFYSTWWWFNHHVWLLHRWDFRLIWVSTICCSRIPVGITTLSLSIMEYVTLRNYDTFLSTLLAAYSHTLFISLFPLSWVSYKKAGYTSYFSSLLMYDFLDWILLRFEKSKNNLNA